MSVARSTTSPTGLHRYFDEASSQRTPTKHSLLGGKHVQQKDQEIDKENQEDKRSNLKNKEIQKAEVSARAKRLNRRNTPVKTKFGSKPKIQELSFERIDEEDETADGDEVIASMIRSMRNSNVIISLRTKANGGDYLC